MTDRADPGRNLWNVDQPPGHRTPRGYVCDLETTCQPVAAPGSRRLPARIQEIWARGMRLVVKDSPALGVFLSVDLPPSHRSSSAAVLACVARESFGPAGERTLDCTFAFELQDEDLEPFRRDQTNGPPGERRRSERLPACGEASYQLLDDAQPARGQATLVEISAAGVGLRTSQRLAVGTKLRLALGKAERKGTFQREAYVVHVSGRSDKDWAVGCTFTRRLSASTLQAILGGRPES
jgi:hypothetical protein